MKRIITLIAAALLSISAFAQFGIEAGLTSPDKSITGSIKKFKALDLYHIGAMYKFSFGNIFAIQPALQYSVRGTCSNSVLTTDDTGVSYRTGYLELPVQLQAGFGIADVVRIYALAEPFIGVAVNALDSTELEIIKTNSFECGANLGIGAEIMKRFQINVAYCWNFGKVAEVKFEDVKLTYANCSGVTFGLAFLFR